MSSTWHDPGGIGVPPSIWARPSGGHNWQLHRNSLRRFFALRPACPDGSRVLLDVNFAKSITIIVTCVFLVARVHSVVFEALLSHTSVNVVFVSVDDCPDSNRGSHEWLDRYLLDICQNTIFEATKTGHPRMTG